MGTSCKIATFADLIKQADDALYVSKQCGRDRSTISTSDIQILKQSSSSLSKILSKSFRQYTPMALVRMDVRNQAVLSEADFAELKATIAGIGRVYDESFITSSLDVLYIVHGKVDVAEFIHRAKDILREKHPNLEYEIH
ncbi:diguanylate cyclase, partial [Aduncisulcus paluster]